MSTPNLNHMLKMNKSEFDKLRIDAQAALVQQLYDFAFEHNRKRWRELNDLLDCATDWQQYTNLCRWIEQNMKAVSA